ncbi:uncharacterized protein LOC143668150 isoform X3 [Tamandua tetradactyla]|uniref:uncharacterized protein LOC143668150 isoform X3 n=1 Tax=Tamandua tetradactyla TaxID=48850 RepID=UPI004053DB18
MRRKEVATGPVLAAHLVARVPESPLVSASPSPRKKRPHSSSISATARFEVQRTLKSSRGTLGTEVRSSVPATVTSFAGGGRTGSEAPAVFSNSNCGRGVWERKSALPLVHKCTSPAGNSSAGRDGVPVLGTRQGLRRRLWERWARAWWTVTATSPPSSLTRIWMMCWRKPRRPMLWLLWQLLNIRENLKRLCNSQKETSMPHKLSYLNHSQAYHAVGLITISVSWYSGFVLPCLGVHPVQGLSPEDQRSVTFEVGLDFSPRFASTDEQKEEQRKVLIRRVQLAKRLNLPLCRQGAVACI